jgi:hypothetical protein
VRLEIVAIIIRMITWDLRLALQDRNYMLSHCLGDQQKNTASDSSMAKSSDPTPCDQVRAGTDNVITYQERLKYLRNSKLGELFGFPQVKS